MKDNLKKKVYNIIQERNLCSYMNNTKWNELCIAMINEMPFYPPYIVKTLFENDCKEEKYFKYDVSYLGDWYELYEVYPKIAIEWIKVRPRYIQYDYIGYLIEPKSKVIDGTEKFLEILKKYNIPYVQENDIYTIYGYK
ncbi:MAG: DUF6678 family protein [Oscillospiraceae bacterium]